MDPIASTTLNLPETIPPKMRLALNMLSDGSRLREIKETTGLHPNTVSRAARKYGVSRGAFKETREALQLVLNKTHSVSEASEQTGVPEHKIYYSLRAQTPGKFRKKRRMNRNANVDRWAEIKAMRDEGTPISEIGAWFAMSRQRVHQILKKYDEYLAEQASKTGA